MSSQNPCVGMLPANDTARQGSPRAPSHIQTCRQIKENRMYVALSIPMEVAHNENPGFRLPLDFPATLSWISVFIQTLTFRHGIPLQSAYHATENVWGVSEQRRVKLIIFSLPCDVLDRVLTSHSSERWPQASEPYRPDRTC